MFDITKKKGMYTVPKYTRKSMRCPTYKVLLLNSKSAVSDIELKQVQDVLADIPESDYYITVEPTPLNVICHYTTSIIVLRRSYEEAKPVSNKIQVLLEQHGIEAKIFKTSLLWEEPAIYLQIK